MLDLMLGVCGMAVLCMMAAAAGARLQTYAGWKTVVLALGTMTAAMGGYMVWLWDRPLLIQLLPFSNAIILGNWLPIVGAFFVGVCLRTAQVARIRRLLLSLTLSVLCAYSLVCPLLGEAPECGAAEVSGRLLEFQTTPQTCSAACAAGLLRLHGIPATEEEMASLCLTRRGTHWLGVFRGLKLKTSSTEWDVVVEEVRPDELTQRVNPPGILALTFTQVSAAHSLESGFVADIGHTVVCLGTSRWKTLEVFDPSPDFGFESWNDRILADVDSGILLRLVSRKGTPSPLQNVDTNRPSTWNERRIASR